MNRLSEQIEAIVRDRLANAKECLAAAKDTFQLKYYKTSAGRLYYAVFNLMRALLDCDGIEMKHHSGVISEFRKRYIKTQIIDSSVSDLISQLYDIRSKSDYSVFYEISAEDIEPFFEETEAFFQEIEALLKSMYDNFSSEKGQ